jgi:rhodanese-related sulfurtransferase
MAIREVGIDELDALLAGGGRLFDVRETDEYVDGHVPGAVHLALNTVPDHVDRFRGDGPLLLICRSGARSLRACEFLEQHGIDAINVAGGTMAWITTGRSVTTGTSPS